MRAFRKLTVPGRAHPIVRVLFAEMNHQQIGVLDLSDRSGVNRNTLRSWRTKTTPTVDNIEACLNVVGLRLNVERIKEDV